MTPIRNNYVFKGHKALLGSRFVTYGELELNLRFEEFPKSKNGFDWGVKNSGALQLSYSMLSQVSNSLLAQENAEKFLEDVVSTLNSRDWILNASHVLDWISKNTTSEIITPSSQESANNINVTSSIYSKKELEKKPKTNVVKEVCIELGITQKTLANILEIPEGTISSWAVKNEIPRLGKKAIEFYILNTKNQQIIDSYKNFVRLLNVS